MLIDTGLLRADPLRARRVRLLGVRGRPASPPQRPSWNYRKEDGGGIIIDMLCHWRYVIDNLFGNVKAVSCLGRDAHPERWDEQGRPYACTADDAAYATFETDQRRHLPLQLAPGACACAATTC